MYYIVSCIPHLILVLYVNKYLMLTDSSYVSISLVIMLSEAHSLVDLTGKAHVNNIL